MQRCLVTFVSQTAAFRFKRLAEDNGLFVKIIQTPKELSRGGCSYAAKCARGDALKLTSLCRRNGVCYSRIFAEFTDTSGRRSYEEIR